MTLYFDTKERMFYLWDGNEGHPTNEPRWETYNWSRPYALSVSHMLARAGLATDTLANPSMNSAQVSLENCADSLPVWKVTERALLQVPDGVDVTEHLCALWHIGQVNEYSPTKER